MDSLSNSVLSSILEYSQLEDQLVTHRLINFRLYRLVPRAMRLRHIDLATLQNLTSKIPTFSWPKITTSEQMDVVSDLLSYLTELIGHRLRSIRFAAEPPLRTEALRLLAGRCPEVEVLNFSLLQSELLLEQLEILPLFEQLRHLRLPKQVGTEFTPILARLRLRTLEIGGENAPLMTADNSGLRHLIISGAPPRAYVENVHCLGDLFPNLRTHDMEKGRENGWRWRIHDEFKNHGEQAVENYRRLCHLRRSRFIDDDPYLFPRTADRLSLSNFFPNLRRLVISLRDYNEEQGDQHPPPWTRTAAVLSHLKHLSELLIEGRNDCGQSAAFRELVTHGLALVPTLRKLELRGRFPVWDRPTADQVFTSIACGRRLRSLTICGTNVACVLEKFLETCPRLREIDYTDELITLFKVAENGSSLASSLAQYSRNLKRKNRLRRLRLRQAVLGVFIANRVRQSTDFIDHKAMVNLGNAGWPNLRELDVRIKDDKQDLIQGPRKQSALSAFFSNMPNLRILKLEVESSDEACPMPKVHLGYRNNTTNAGFLYGRPLGKLPDDFQISRPGGLLRRILQHLPRLEEMSIDETKIDADIGDWVALCSHGTLRKFTCHLNQHSHRLLDEGLSKAVVTRRNMIDDHGYRLPLLQAFIFDCSNQTRTLPLVGDGDSVVDAKARLRIIIPESSGSVP